MIQPITLLPADDELAAKKTSLEGILRSLGSVLVAYSGGADSTLLLRMAHETLGDAAVAAIAISESMVEEEAVAATMVADGIGVQLHRVFTREFENERYRANNPDRCYHCKIALFEELEPLAERLGMRHVVYGANVDDLGDYRPGQHAARQRGVRAPLVEAGFSKLEVRELSRQLGLPTWNKPSLACLSSRVPYGTRIEPEMLDRIDQAERFLGELGVIQRRVRAIDTTVCIETDLESIALLTRPDVRPQVVARMKHLGYDRITLDLEGYRTGSMNPKRRPSTGVSGGTE